MDSAFSKLPLVLLVFSSFIIHEALGEVICEDLKKEVCSFSVSSSGKRCLLEKYYLRRDGSIEYQCRTSEVVVEKMKDWIETDGCVRACGVDRNMVGISSDSLMEPQFTSKLCSPACHQNCPNIVDLYFNLAEGEGVFLPNLCELQRTNPHRAMVELLSSGVAPGPVSNNFYSPTTKRELLNSGVAPGPVSDNFYSPTTKRELLGSGVAPGPVSDNFYSSTTKHELLGSDDAQGPVSDEFNTGAAAPASI